MTLTDSPPADFLEAAILERVLHAALRRGGEFAEIFAEDRASSGISLDNRKVEELSSGHDRGAGIRVIVGETTGFAHTADLSEAGLLAAAEAAAAVAREGGGPVREIALSRQTPHGRSGETTLPSTVAKSAKVDLLLQPTMPPAGGQCDRAGLAGYGDSRRRIVVANSDGLLTSDDQVRTRLFVNVCRVRRHRPADRIRHSLARTIGFEVFDDHGRGGRRPSGSTTGPRKSSPLDPRPRA
jgi:TldD protein